jgi:hypothetical protein
MWWLAIGAIPVASIFTIEPVHCNTSARRAVEFRRHVQDDPVSGHVVRWSMRDQTLQDRAFPAAAPSPTTAAVAAASV